MVDNGLKKALDKRGMVVTNMVFSLKTMSHVTALKKFPTPEKFTFEQLEEMARYMGVGTVGLMEEIGLL